MGKIDYGKDYEYASSRLRNSVVRTSDGKAVYVKEVNPDCEAYIADLMGNSLGYVPLKDLDLSPVPLGFVNCKAGSARYSFRTPSRFYKQGLTNETLRGLPHRPDLFSKQMAQTIEGKFPNVRDCMEDVCNGEVVNKAFSRNFCVGKRLNNNRFALLFRDTLVGVFKWNVGALNVNYELEKDYQYLQEMVEGEINV